MPTDNTIYQRHVSFFYFRVAIFHQKRHCNVKDESEVGCSLTVMVNFVILERFLNYRFSCAMSSLPYIIGVENIINSYWRVFSFYSNAELKCPFQLNMIK